MYFNLKKKHIHFHTWIYEAALHAAVLFYIFHYPLFNKGFCSGGLTPFLFCPASWSPIHPPGGTFAVFLFFLQY